MWVWAERCPGRWCHCCSSRSGWCSAPGRAQAGCPETPLHCILSSFSPEEQKGCRWKTKNGWRNEGILSKNPESTAIVPWETVSCSQYKVRRDQDSSADMGSSVVQRQLPRPLTLLGYWAPNDPGGRVLFTTVWTQHTQLETKKYILFC